MPRRHSFLILIPTLAVAMTVGACDPPTRACPSDLRLRLSPVDTVLRVGQSFRPSSALYACAGRDKLAVDFEYAAEDTAVVRVDSATQRIHAVAVGGTHVLVMPDQPYGVVLRMRVQVVAAP